jgi:predicted lipoprotein with Yx(FWY)xxD motif
MGARWSISVILGLTLSSGLVGFSGRAAQSMTLPVNVGAANVAGQSQGVLVDVNGLTLYYLTSDSVSNSACTGKCLHDRPAVLSDSLPPTPSSVPNVGFLGVANNANGSQVTYSGHFLYRYAGDHQMGDAGGEGAKGPDGGVWHAATPWM